MAENSQNDSNDKNRLESSKESIYSENAMKECNNKKKTPFCIDALLSNKNNIDNIESSENYEISEKESFYDNYEDTGLSGDYKRSR